jgi:hypothetical protein
MARHASAAAAALMIATAAMPLSAQRPADAPTYVAAVLTPVGALPPLVTPAQLGTPRYGIGLDVRYGYGELSGTRNLPMHAVGAQAELALIGGFLSVSGTGAYLIPDCGPARHCEEYPMFGAGASLKVGRWTVEDLVSRGYVTLALEADAGLGLPKGGQARAASAGPSVTFVGERGTLRVIGFVTPRALWGRLRIDDPARFDAQLGSVFALADSTFEREGVRVMAEGGLALVSTRTGIGLHVSVERVIVHGARARVGASLSWRSTRFR